MQKQNFAQDILDFNKNAVKMSCDVISTFSAQAAKTADQILEMTPNVPEEGKKVVDLFFKENQKGLSNLRKCVETGLDVDWTSQEAPVKGIEAMESLYNSAFSQASAIQKETKELFKKTSEQLPKEAKPMVDFWNEALNSNVQIFQSFVTRNFELAKKVMADVAAEAPKAAAKTAAK
jgi:hypothetical protein